MDIAAMTKKDDGLVQALAAAPDHLIAGRQNAATLTRWNLAHEAVPHSPVNPPGLPKTA